MKNDWLNSNYGKSKLSLRFGTPLVIFLSGLDNFDTDQTFRPVIQNIPKSFGTLSVDYLNTGLSKPAKRNFKLKSWIDDLSKYVENLHVSKIIIVAHSIGGIIALRLIYKLHNVIGFIGIEPTSKEVATDPSSNKELLRKVMKYKKMSTKNLLKLMKNKINNDFSPHLAKDIWNTFIESSKLNPKFHCMGINNAIKNNLKYRIPKKMPSIIFTEKFRENEYKRSEYYNQSTIIYNLGNIHYIHWDFPKSISKGIKSLNNTNKY